MSSDLIKIAESLSDRRVLLVGDLMLDRYVYGDAERISPEAPVPVLREVDQQERVGGSGSVAANLRALGLDVICCGVLGLDGPGNNVIELLEEAGINCGSILRTKDRPTTTKTRFVGLAQHRHRQQLLRFDQEHTAPLTNKQSDYILKVVDKVIQRVDVVCVEDYNKGLLSRELVSQICERARQQGKSVLVDPAAIADFERYCGATLLTPNRNELAAAMKQRFTNLQDMGQAAASLASRLDLEAIVVTVDKEGAILAHADGDVKHIPTKPRAVYDNTGAGDAVLAMMAAAMAAGATLEQAVQMANIAGGLEVEKFGCVPITRDEVLADLRIEHHRKIGKLRTLEDLLGELQLRRDRGEAVAFTNGCFDLLHRGHVEYLQEASEQADILVVGLNSDSSVRQQNKGSDRPIVSQEDRCAVLSALQPIDYIVMFDEPTPEKLIEAVRPEVLVKGEDWLGKTVAGQSFVESCGGRVVFAKLREGCSTSSIINKIRTGR